MAGGPINGVSWGAMFQTFGAGTYASSAPTYPQENPDPNNPVNYTGIIVPTVLQIAADAVSCLLKIKTGIQRQP
jgi:hypothetical protein